MFEPNGLHNARKYQYELSWPVRQVLYKVSENLHPNMDDRALAFAQHMITALYDSMLERIESSLQQSPDRCLGRHFQLKSLSATKLQPRHEMLERVASSRMAMCERGRKAANYEEASRTE